jgi:hypothetical protein
MKFLRGIGWLFIPYIMLPIRWKKIGKLGKSIGTLWAVIALISFIHNLSSSNQSAQPATAPTVTTNSAVSNEKAPEAKPTAAPQLSKEGVSSNVKIAVEGFETKAKVGDNEMSQAKAQGVFKVVKLSVTNNQKDAITLDSNSFKLVDSQGREFTASTEAQTALEMSGSDKNSFFLKQLNPGLSAEGEIAFDVPKDAKGFVLKARGGFTGDEIKLKVQ